LFTQRAFATSPRRDTGANTMIITESINQ